MTSYTFTKIVDVDRLSHEIRNSAITAALDHVDLDYPDKVTVYFRTVLTLPDQSVLAQIISSHTGEPFDLGETQKVEISGVATQGTGAEKAMLVAPLEPEGSATFLVSHNFCDMTTWYSQSVQVVQDVLTTTDHLKFSSANKFWIDLTHGKMPYENKYAAQYPVRIYANETEITTGFTVDYADGSVTFSSSQVGKNIKATYSYATGSAWLVRPTTGKSLKVLGTSIRTSGIEYTNMQLYYGIYYNETPVTLPVIYNGMRDLLVCSLGEISTIPANFYPGQNSSITFMPFDYTRIKALKYSQGVHLRMGVTGNQPLQGDWAYVVANCVSVDET